MLWAEKQARENMEWEEMVLFFLVRLHPVGQCVTELVWKPDLCILSVSKTAPDNKSQEHSFNSRGYRLLNV